MDRFFRELLKEFQIPKFWKLVFSYSSGIVVTAVFLPRFFDFLMVRAEKDEDPNLRDVSNFLKYVSYFFTSLFAAAFLYHFYLIITRTRRRCMIIASLLTAEQRERRPRTQEIREQPRSGSSSISGTEQIEMQRVPSEQPRGIGISRGTQYSTPEPSNSFSRCSSSESPGGSSSDNLESSPTSQTPVLPQQKDRPHSSASYRLPERRSPRLAEKYSKLLASD